MNAERGGDPRGWFAQRLHELWQAAGSPKLDQVAARAKVRTPDGLPTGKVLSAWKTGTNLPQTWNRFAPVLELLIRLTHRHNGFNGRTSGLDNPDMWRSWWENAASPRGTLEVKAPKVRGRPRWRLVPVTECKPSWVGVHRSVTRADADPAANTAVDIPAYVRRDFDEELRRSIRAASATGGFILVVGGSSVGKSRSLYEAVTGKLGSWDLLLADDAAAVRDAAAVLRPRTVVWLDDTPVPRYLTEIDGGGLTRSDLLQLLRNDDSRPVVFIDTMWPNVIDAANDIPTVSEGGRRPTADLYRDVREFIALADHYIEVAGEFSRGERRRAAALAVSDSRLAAALADRQFGFTQHLAGAPELVRRWLHGDAHSTAVITAAVDCRRIGIDTPLKYDTLKRAAVGYLSERQRATTPDDWFDTALNSATAEGKGTSAPLLPCSTDDDLAGAMAGYSLAEYLVDYGLRYRTLSPIPGTVWEALMDSQDGDELYRLARTAYWRGLFTYAGDLYLRSYAVGKSEGLRDFVRLLADQGRDEELQKLAQVDYEAGKYWARFLEERGNAPELRALAIEKGYPDAIWSFLDLLNRQGGFDEGLAEVLQLRNRLKGHNWIGEIVLPEMLRQLDRTKELSELAAAGDKWAADALQRGPWEPIAPEAPEPRQAPASLLPPDQLNEAIDRLRERVTGAHKDAQTELAHLLADHGEVEELRLLIVATGNFAAHARLRDLLAEQGPLKDLQALIRNGLNPDGTIASEALVVIVDGIKIQWWRPKTQARRTFLSGTFLSEDLLNW